MVVLRSRGILRLLFITGALLLAKGSFTVLPFLLPPRQSAEVSVTSDYSQGGVRFDSGVPLFDLSLPRQKVRFTVVEGTTTAALRKGPGHLEGSPMPGTPGNSVIAGHRDTHFRTLKDVIIGDEIRIDIGGKQLRYRIFDIRVVPPADVSVLKPKAADTITLITCYPFHFFGPAPDRYIVHARTISE